MSTLKANSLTNIDNSGSANIALSTDGSTTVQNLTADNVTATSYNTGQLAGLRNQLINGNMVIWQRGTNFSDTGTTGYGYRTADRWWCQGTFDANGQTVQLASTSTQVTGMPKEFAYAFCYYTQDDISTRSSFLQPIELAVGNDKCRGLAPFAVGQKWTMSCYCTSDIAAAGIEAKLMVAEDAGDSTGPYLGGPVVWTQIEAPTATRWGRYAVTFTILDAAFTDATRCIRANFGAIGTVASDPNFASITSRVAITGCQLEPGPVATPFEQRPIGLELSLCQRYYQQASNYVNPMARASISSGTAVGFESFVVTMRTSPTVTGTATRSPYSASNASPTGFTTSVTGLADNESCSSTSFAADAEL